SGSATESMGGIAVIVLAILSLVGIIPAILAPIAAIVFGVAFFIEGAALGAKQTALMDAAAAGEIQRMELGGGVTVEVMTGIGCAVLGILSLIGIANAYLLPIAVIVAGAGLILSAGAVQGLNDLSASVYNLSAAVQSMARRAVSGAAAAQLMAGAATLALGIIALCRNLPYPSVLTMVGLLIAGISITLSGAALSGNLLRLFRRA
ncbi:MAG: hypothetical protein ACREEX_15470, partial [Caulobacteraceae bacterium]